MQAGRSGLIVEVSEAEPFVREHRARHDRQARLGVPAHITILFPFMAPKDIDDQVLGQLGDVFKSTEPFGFQLDHCDWFANDVLWLAPSHPEAFRSLTTEVVRHFPEYLP